jgi:hypothetical protein
MLFSISTNTSHSSLSSCRLLHKSRSPDERGAYANKLAQSKKELNQALDVLKIGGKHTHNVYQATSSLIVTLLEKKIDVAAYFTELSQGNKQPMLEEFLDNECWLSCREVLPYLAPGYYCEGKVKVTERTIEKLQPDGVTLGIRYQDVGLYGGELRDSLQHGYGTMTFWHGSDYVGNWENGKQNGYGHWFLSDKKTVIKGYFKNGWCYNQTNKSSGFWGSVKKICGLG